MLLKKMIWAGLISSVVMLSGCGNNYNGMYRAMDGIIGPMIVLTINGSEAKAIKIDPFLEIRQEDFLHNLRFHDLRHEAT